MVMREKFLPLCNSDRLEFTQFFTGTAIMTFISVQGHSFVVDQFIDLAGTPFYTFSTTITFFFVNGELPHS